MYHKSSSTRTSGNTTHQYMQICNGVMQSNKVYYRTAISWKQEKLDIDEAYILHQCQIRHGFQITFSFKRPVMCAALHKFNHSRDSHSSSSMVVDVESFPSLQYKLHQKARLICYALGSKEQVSVTRNTIWNGLNSSSSSFYTTDKWRPHK